MLENSQNQLSKVKKKPLQNVVRQIDRVKKDKILTEHPPGLLEPLIPERRRHFSLLHHIILQNQSVSVLVLLRV